MGKKFLLLVLTSFTVLILGVASFTFQFVISTRASIHEEVDRNEKSEGRLENINFKDGDPITILLMGLDSRPGEIGGRADTMVLLTINPHSESMHMVSIPRDTYTNIKGGLNKINSSYQVGGAEMTLNSVENLLDVPVDYFVKVNMKGFEGIVDAVGEVEVYNDLDFTYGNVHFPKGQLKLDGNEALLYARMRKEDPRGDFGRQKRQRQVIEALMQKGESLSSITKFGEIVKVLKDNVKTNMKLNEMLKIQSNYKGARENIEQHKIEGTDKTIKGTYYYMPDKKKLHDISDNLKKHLELNNNDPGSKEVNETNELEEKGSKESGENRPDDSTKEKEEPAKQKDTETNELKEESSKESEDNNTVDSTKEKEESDKQKENGDKDSEEETVKNSDKSNVNQVITENWPSVPTSQENHTRVTFDEGSLDWEEMTTAISKGAGLSKSDMILWWVGGNGTNSVIATVTNKAQTDNYRVYVSWVDGAGYTPTKVEVLYENDKKQ
nr:DUF1510 family protein [Cytobacillus firmus]